MFSLVMLFLFGCINNQKNQVQKPTWTTHIKPQKIEKTAEQTIDEDTLQDIEQAVAEVENITIENISDIVPDEDLELPDAEELC